MPVHVGAHVCRKPHSQSAIEFPCSSMPPPLGQQKQSPSAGRGSGRPCGCRHLEQQRSSSRSRRRNRNLPASIDAHRKPSWRPTHQQLLVKKPCAGQRPVPVARQRWCTRARRWCTRARASCGQSAHADASATGTHAHNVSKHTTATIGKTKSICAGTLPCQIAARARSAHARWTVARGLLRRNWALAGKCSML